MKCFFPFKDKTKSKKQGAQSAPELRNQSKSSDLVLDRATKSSSSLPSPRSIPELYKEKEHNLRVFSYQELREATNGFNRLLKLGEGGFGSVYKGTISPEHGQGSPIVVAIKRLNPRSLQVRYIFINFLCLCFSIPIFLSVSLFFFSTSTWLGGIVICLVLLLDVRLIVMVALNDILYLDGEFQWCVF